MARRLAQLHPDIAYIPGMQGLRGQRVGQLEAHLGTIAHIERVGQITGIAGLIVIVAVIAEQLAQAGTLCIEGSHIEGVAFLGLGFA